MPKTFSLLAVGVAVSVGSGLATFLVMANQETAAETEIYLCILVAAAILLSR